MKKVNGGKGKQNEKVNWGQEQINEKGMMERERSPLDHFLRQKKLNFD